MQVAGEENMTQIKREPFNARDFSSRKLIELVLDDSCQRPSDIGPGGAGFRRL